MIFYGLIGLEFCKGVYGTTLVEYGYICFRVFTLKEALDAIVDDDNSCDIFLNLLIFKSSGDEDSGDENDCNAQNSRQLFSQSVACPRGNSLWKPEQQIG